MWFSFWFNSTFTFSFKFTFRSFLQLFSLFVLHNDQKTNILQMNGKKKFVRILLYKISNILAKRRGDGPVEKKVASQSALPSKLGGFLTILISFSTLPISHDVDLGH